MSELTTFEDKIKDVVKEMYPGKTKEYIEYYLNNQEPYLELHHIFMKSEYTKYSNCPENLIDITAGQHRGLAHRDGNLRKCDPRAQCVLLCTKLETICYARSSGNVTYSLERFKHMLSDCLENDSFLELNTKDEIRNEIIKTYKEKLRM